MKRINRAKEIHRNNGIKDLLMRTTKYMRAELRRFRQGGLSSRPVIEPVGGFTHPLFDWWFNQKHGCGTDVMAEDWDTLVLLDACRYDDFVEYNSLPGNLESRISKGADSRRFIINNFYNRELHDTVYVTANPHVSLIDDATFHAIIDEPIDGWDSEIKCVPPQKVSKAAMDAHERFPNKRIIVHYMQPHDPPIGPTGNKLRAEMNLAGPVPGGGKAEGTRLLPAVAKGQIELEVARKAYRETLEIVLDELEAYIYDIEGKVVVSADHGEMFGEQPYPILGALYEHYYHPRTVELCQIPWFILDTDSRRRNIVSDPPDQKRKINQQKIDNQLEALGYK